MPGVIVGFGPEPRSYTLKCNTTGRMLRRNRQLLRPRHVDIPDHDITDIMPPEHIHCRPAARQETIVPPPTLQPPKSPKPQSPDRSPQKPNRVITTPKKPSGTQSTTSAQQTSTTTRSGRVSRPPKRLIET